MPWITDPRLLEIYESRTCHGLPPEVCHIAHRKSRLLRAATSLADIDVFTPLGQLDDGRLVAPLHGKWVIAFDWTEGVGASDLTLQRL